MMFKSLYLLLTTLSGLAIAKQHQPPSPKLAFAYSVEISIIEQVPITSPFAETACKYRLRFGRGSDEEKAQHYLQ